MKHPPQQPPISIGGCAFARPNSVESLTMPRPVSKTGNEVTATIPNELEVIASLMDNALRIPGTSVRVGFDSIIGLIPGAGDLATSLVSLYIVSAAGRCGASRATQFRMALNIVIDSLVGAVPLVGDVFDVYW